MKIDYRADERDPSKVSRWKKLCHSVHKPATLFKGNVNVTRSVFTIDLQHRNYANRRVHLTDWLGLPV